MSNWISSKLKVAETFLQQIDQQAAESLKKNENPRSDDVLRSETERKSAELVVPLKDQLKKKKKSTERNELTGNVRSENKLNLVTPRSSSSSSSSNRDNKEVGASIAANASPSLSPPKPGLTDTDWTELLGVPSQPTSPSVKNSKGVVPGIRGLRSDGRKQNLGSNLSPLEAKKKAKSQTNSLRASPKSAALGNEVNGGSTDQRRSDGEDSRVMVTTQRAPVPDLGNSDNYSSEGQFDSKFTSRSPSPKSNDIENAKPNGISKINADNEYLQNKNSSTVMLPSNKDPVVEMPKAINDVSEIKTAMSVDRSRFRSSTGRINELGVAKMNLPAPRKESRSVSDDGSDSSTDSTSSSDSESEREREERKKRRAQILAEKAAAKAIEAIKERENMVARLEGEKLSLEKILEERAKQQAREASELQNTTMEMMEAADVEKQKHNATRMEALSRLAKLETANATLARSLANAQKNHEVAINQTAELRQQVELKEASQEELRRKITASHGSGIQLVSSKGVELEREILEAEHSFVAEKVERLKEKKKALETNIETTQKEMEQPTEVEVELKRRLGQLTDHLIRKQAQVESLSSEKATILFRIEAVSRSLDESKSMLDPPSGMRDDDIESGSWEFSNSRLRPMFEQRMQSGRKHLGSLVGQLDSVFCAGAAFLRRNSAARMWSLGYLVCLHIWVMYILFSRSSPVADEFKSGAVFSLENLNNTGGV